MSKRQARIGGGIFANRFVGLVCDVFLFVWE